jgi:adenine-specific DNA methylase
MKTLTVKEAVDRVNSGQNLEGVHLDKESLKQVNVRDAMILNSGGIVVPEENLYYDDNDIVYDEEIDELVIGEEITGLSWEEKINRFQNYQNTNEDISINLSTQDQEFNKWIEMNKGFLEKVLRPIVKNLFDVENLANNKCVFIIGLFYCLYRLVCLIHKRLTP